MGLLGMALEGGGARGSYQAGAAKALIENGYHFNGFVGTSIGAINSALLAQGELETMIELWNTTEVSSLFDIDDEIVKYIINMQFDMLDMVKIQSLFTKMLAERGADTSKIRKMLDDIIDEKKIRQSGNDFGLVTVALPDLRPYEVMLDEISEGKLVDYIMASSCFPGFKAAQIGPKTFIDGGFYDNLPINMLAKRGYKEIYALRTFAPGIIRKLEYADVEVKTIKPSDDLGLLMYFSSEQAKININLGYFDTIKMINRLTGFKYYLKPISDDTAFDILKKLDDVVIAGISKPIGINEAPNRKLFFERTIPSLSSKLKLPKGSNYSDFLVAALEYIALKWNVPRFELYDFSSFYRTIRTAVDATPRKKEELNPLDTSVLRLIAAICPTYAVD